MSESCKSCRYQHQGDCRRYAPREVNHSNFDRGWWPGVSLTDWCGEYEPRQSNAARVMELARAYISARYPASKAIAVQIDTDKTVWIRTDHDGEIQLSTDEARPFLEA